MKQREIQKWPVGRYKLTEKAFMGRVPGAQHELLDAGTEVASDVMPAPHFEPLDTQARANVEHALKVRGPQTLDPTQSLSLVLGEVDDVDSEIDELMARIEALKATRRGVQVRGGAVQAAPAAPPQVVPDPADTPKLATLPGLPPPTANAPPPPPL